MSDYIDFLFYGSLENSDSDDSDYYPSGDSQSDSDFSPSQDSQSSQSERTLKTLTLKLYHNYYTAISKKVALVIHDA